MAKPSRDTLQDDGERLLANWDVPGEATAADLAPHAGRAPAADVAIAHRLGTMAGGDSVELLQRLDRSAADKRVRKAVKRAVYRLRQRGVHVPEAPSEPARALFPPPAEGYVSPVDGGGDQLVWLLKPRPDGLAHLYAIINDPEGLREAELNVATRKAVKRVRSELAAKHELHLVDADWRYCDFLMHRAFAWARARQTTMTGDYPALRAQILRDPAPEDLPPLVLARCDAAAIKADAGLLSRSAELLAEKEFRTWFLGPDEVKPYLDELASIRESPLVLNRHQQTDRMREVVEQAVTERFGGDRRESYVRRLYAMAYFFSATARPERANQAVAVALALAESERGGQNIPFCDELVRASVAAWVEAAAEREAERAKSSLVVTPQQFAAERQRR